MSEIIQFTEAQSLLFQLPALGKAFLEGPAGTGKTTAGCWWLRRLLENGTPKEQVLVLLPQRTLSTPYLQVFEDERTIQGGVATVITLDGLAQRLIHLFWPSIASQAGFAYPEYLPTFLTLETAQFYMAQIVRPLLAEGRFNAVTLERNRLYSQLLDSINKSAIMGYSHGEIGERLKSAWVGDASRLRQYDDAQVAINQFRILCLRNNLLDYSLQVELLRCFLWPDENVRRYLRSTYRYLLVDNVEEDTPVAHDILLEWMNDFDAGCILYDWNGGYRNFLGADPTSAYRLKDPCEYHLLFEEPLTASSELIDLSLALRAHIYQLGGNPNQDASDAEPRGGLLQGLPFEFNVQRYFPEMLDWIAEQIRQLVIEQGVPSGEIVVLAPFMTDALRFSLQNRLFEVGITTHSHRPSRALREEPATRCLLTLASICYPEWGFCPERSDFTSAMVQAIDGMDWIRAGILSEIVYRVREGRPVLNSFEEILPDAQERITYGIGARYEVLRHWILSAQAEPLELDHLLSRLFGEVLSQPGFGFHSNLDAGATTANLIESIQKFRWVLGDAFIERTIPLGKIYLETIQDGLVAAQYLTGWENAAEEGVKLAPAYSFLLSNQPVDFQFWINPGSRGWSERLNQPLTHPYVLHRSWPEGSRWTDQEEVHVGMEQLARLVEGLLRRCRRGIFLALSEIDDQGYEERGLLLQAFQKVLAGEVNGTRL